MPGIPGMAHRNPRRNTVRAQAWQSMRIFRSFSIPDLLRTVPCASKSNLTKWVRGLVRKGYLREEGWVGCSGQSGSFKVFRLIKGQDDPTPPVIHEGELTRGTDRLA